MSSSKFDIVVYGATGFTGQLVAEYLAAHYKGDANLKWAMAGRSKDKLASVRDAIGAPADTPLIVADASDPASLKAMVEQTKSVITTVGPYQLYGNELLAACVASGTDYFDLCGEPIWMRQMIDTHEAAAKASGARIVFSCGFDSVPFELGAFFVQEEAKRVFGAPASRVKGRVRDMRGTLVRRHRGERRGDVRGGGQGSQPGCDAEGSVRADARVQGPEAAAGQQAGLRGRPAVLDRAVHDGADQHPQRPSLQHADGFSLRQGVRLRRDGADGRRREGRGQRQARDGRQHRKDRSRCAQAGRGAVEGRARERPLRSAVSSRSRPTAGRSARR